LGKYSKKSIRLDGISNEIKYVVGIAEKIHKLKYLINSIRIDHNLQDWRLRRPSSKLRLENGFNKKRSTKLRWALEDWRLRRPSSKLRLENSFNKKTLNKAAMGIGGLAHSSPFLKAPL